jgi:hypothetical protein
MSIPSYFIKNDPETWDISAFASQQLLDFPGLTFDELQNSIYRSLKFIEGSENIAKKVRDRASTLIEGWKVISLYLQHT